MPVTRHHGANDVDQNACQNHLQDQHRTHSIGLSAKQRFHALSHQPQQQSARISPTLKGALIGAVAGRMLPVLGSVSGAIIGGLAGKWLDHKQSQRQQFQTH